MNYKEIEKVLKDQNNELFNELEKLGNTSLTGKELDYAIMQSKKIAKNHSKIIIEIEGDKQ